MFYLLSFYIISLSCFPPSLPSLPARVSPPLSPISDFLSLLCSPPFSILPCPHLFYISLSHLFCPVPVYLSLRLFSFRWPCRLPLSLLYLSLSLLSYSFTIFWQMKNFQVSLFSVFPFCLHINEILLGHGSASQRGQHLINV